MTQHGPRDTGAVIEGRYWLTPKAYAVLAQIEANNTDTAAQENR